MLLSLSRYDTDQAPPLRAPGAVGIGPTTELPSPRTATIYGSAAELPSSPLLQGAPATEVVPPARWSSPCTPPPSSYPPARWSSPCMRHRVGLILLLPLRGVLPCTAPQKEVDDPRFSLIYWRCCPLHRGLLGVAPPCKGSASCWW
jgi:hypothetical protein